MRRSTAGAGGSRCVGFDGVKVLRVRAQIGERELVREAAIRADGRPVGSLRGGRAFVRGVFATEPDAYPTSQSRAGPFQHLRGDAGWKLLLGLAD